MKKQLTFLSIVSIAILAMANDNTQQRPMRGKPPQEAFNACSGKSINDTCNFTTPRGDTIEGVCQNPHGKEVLCIPNDHLRRPPVHSQMQPRYTPTENIEPPSVTTTFIIPDTNQEKCFDSSGEEIECMLSGQDGMYLKNTPSFTLNGNGTVTDDITGVMWQQSPDTNKDGVIDKNDKMTPNEAMEYCSSLNLGGYDDWVLPDIKTLYSLIDFSGQDVSGGKRSKSHLKPFIDTSAFDFAYGDEENGERIIDVQYVSSTFYTANKGQVFGVNLADGRIKGYGLKHPMKGDKTFNVQCARNIDGYGQNNFVDNNNGTVSDVATGLMWQKFDSKEPMSWDDALNYCETSEIGKFRDWKLPNAKELQSIVDYTKSPDTTNSAALSGKFITTSFINENGQKDFGYFWTSTTHENLRGNGTQAVYISFGRSLGYMRGNFVDIHGAGAQRSDPKDMSKIKNDRAAKKVGQTYTKGPQGDVLRGLNYVRCVRIER